MKHNVRQYLAELEQQNPTEEPVHQQEQVSTTDPDATYATKGGTPALPVHLSISQDISDYLRFAESLCDKLADALATSDSLTPRLRTEVRNWKFKRVNAGPLTVEPDTQRFLTSGSALLSPH